MIERVPTTEDLYAALDWLQLRQGCIRGQPQCNQFDCTDRPASDIIAGIMASVTVRNVPDKVLQGIKEQARRHGTSMEGEIRDILERETLDRQLLFRLIEEEIRGQQRATTADEVDCWIRDSREGRPKN